jgi:hypothetical protein
MRRTALKVLTSALVLSAFPLAAQCARAAAAGATPVIHIEDVGVFYKIYDAAGGHPTADQLQHYIDHGSEGLRHLAKVRNVSGARIADAISKRPEIYTNARRCMDVLPRVRERLQRALRKLLVLYPEAKIEPITIAVGRGRPVAIADGDNGVQVGLEALCDTKWMNPNLEDRFVHTIAHEYGHVQQFTSFANDEYPTGLEEALMEGGAEFTAELISGAPAYSEQNADTRGHEKEIETAFAADEDSTDPSRWFGNSTADKGGDLGYWVGYRICKAYYQNTKDKRRAFRDIMEISDPKRFLAMSGWYPGIELN